MLRKQKEGVSHQLGLGIVGGEGPQRSAHSATSQLLREVDHCPDVSGMILAVIQGKY